MPAYNVKQKELHSSALYPPATKPLGEFTAMAGKQRGRTVRCSVCRTKLGIERTVKDSGMFRMVKTEYTAPHFHYVVDYGSVSLRCIPCAAPGYSPEFKARMEGYAERERRMIAERRADKIARGLSVGTHDPGQSYLDDIARVAAAYQEDAGKS